jgi:hypothetical protein
MWVSRGLLATMGLIVSGLIVSVDTFRKARTMSPGDPTAVGTRLFDNGGSGRTGSGRRRCDASLTGTGRRRGSDELLPGGCGRLSW